MRKKRGHFCWRCGRHRANEKFSGKGHAAHVCQDCAREAHARRRTVRKERLARQEAVRQGIPRKNEAFRHGVRSGVDRYFARRPDAVLHRRVNQALRWLADSDHPLAGAPAGWAGGVVYAFRAFHAWTPRASKASAAEFEATFGVSMSTIRRRAADAARVLPFFKA